MARQLLVILLAIALSSPALAALAAPAAAEEGEGVQFTLSLAPPIVEEGNELSVLIAGENLADLYAYEFTVRYDSKKLKFQQALSEVAGFSVAPLEQAGQVVFAHTQTGASAGISGHAALSKLTFVALQPGEAEIKLVEAKAVDSELRVQAYKPKSTAVQVKIAGDSDAAFADMLGHWAEAAVNEAAERGIVQGYGDGTFRPDRLVTRAEFVVMLARAMGLQLAEANEQPEAVFADDESIPAWARPAVAAAAARGIIIGYDDERFRPTNALIRTEAAVLAVRSLPLQAQIQGAALGQLPFADQDDVPVWAQAELAVAVQLGLVQGRGDGRFSPREAITRAEAATLLLSAIKFDDYSFSSR